MTFEDMDKEYEAIRTVALSSGNIPRYTYWDAMDRYDAAKKLMESQNIWEAWCKSRGFAPSHTGFDCFA